MKKKIKLLKGTGLFINGDNYADSQNYILDKMNSEPKDEYIGDEARLKERYVIIIENNVTSKYLLVAPGTSQSKKTTRRKKFKVPWIDNPKEKGKYWYKKLLFIEKCNIKEVSATFPKEVINEFIESLSDGFKKVHEDYFNKGISIVKN